MERIRISALVIIILFPFVIIACNKQPLTPTPAPNFQATLEVALRQTLEARSVEGNLPRPTPTKAYAVKDNPSGWKYYVYKDLGFAITLPSTWLPLELSEDTIDLVLSSAAKAYPQLEEFYSSSYFRDLAQMGIKLIAIDTSTSSIKTGAFNNLNIVVLDMLFDISFDELVEVNIQQLQEIYGDNFTFHQERIWIGDIESELIEYELELLDTFGHPQQRIIKQYLFLKNKRQVVLTFSLAKENYAQYQYTIGKILYSFHFIEQ